jgi:hypothetical protein
LQQLTILVINYTGWDVWLARAVGFALIWVPSLFVLRFIGGFITPGMVFIKKGRRGLFIAGGLCMFLAMHFISKNVNFSPITGEPLKKYVRHSDCSVELFPVEMEYDPYFGDPLRIITRDIVKDVEKQKKGIVILSVVSSPTGAEMYLDWKKIGYTPLKLETGNRRVRLILVKEGYEPEFRDSVDCIGGDSLSFTMQPQSHASSNGVILIVKAGPMSARVFNSMLMELRRKQIPVLDQASQAQYQRVSIESGGLQNMAFRNWLKAHLHADYILNVSCAGSTSELDKQKIGNDNLQSELKGLFSTSATLNADLIDVQTGTVIEAQSSTEEGLFLDKEEGLSKCISKTAEKSVRSIEKHFNK